MSIQTKTFDELEPALSLLERLAHARDTYVFRGHNRSEYRLLTTSERYYRLITEVTSPMLAELLSEFRVGLTKINAIPFEGDNRQDWLEYARHCGIPTPCLDFTYSPYVALFFAFTGVSDPPRAETENEYVVVYALNVNQLATAWLRFWHRDSNAVDFSKAHWSFREQDDSFFEKEFPVSLKFLPSPGRHIKKMQKQHGALIYAPVDWEFLHFKDLEDFIDKTQEPSERLPDGTEKAGDYTLTKVFINTKCIRSVFEKLELTLVTGATLFEDASGVAMDIMNSRHYVAKTNTMRDINFPLV